MLSATGSSGSRARFAAAFADVAGLADRARIVVPAVRPEVVHHSAERFPARAHGGGRRRPAETEPRRRDATQLAKAAAMAGRSRADYQDNPLCGPRMTEPPDAPRSTRARRRLRRTIIRTLGAGQRGHVGAAFSLVEILRVLYDDVLALRPAGTHVARARPLHPQQGPRLPRALRHARGQGLLPGGGAARSSARATECSAAIRSTTSPASRPRPAASATACPSASASR